MKCDAVFEGGGVKGIAFVGAIQETERHGYQFQRLAGTSAGSIVASLLAAGYTGDEIESFAPELSFVTFLDLDWFGRVPFIGKGLNLILRNGIYSARQIEKWVDEKLKKKGVRYFGDLPENKLRIIASDISNGRMMELPDDLADYDKDPRHFPIARAVRMSCTIPYFFQPSILRQDGQRVYVVDGGLLSNFPVWIFDAKEKIPRWPTFGFRLRASDEPSPARITGPLTLSVALLSTMREAHDRRYITPKDAERTIFIPVEDVRATDFSLSDEQINKLIQLGQEEAQQFFEKWNFPSYLSEHRGIPISVTYRKQPNPVQKT